MPFVADPPTPANPAHATLAPLPSPRITYLVAGILLFLMGVFILSSVRQESQTFDEATHLFAGFEYWKHADFGRNPEHPPMAKFVAAVPLLSMHLREPSLPPIPYFKAQDFIGGSQLLYTAKADRILFRGRAIMLLFPLALAFLVFIAARQMFDDWTALLALAMVVFEPVLLANGALVTTDVPLTCAFFAAVYSFYRFARRPSVANLAATALCTILTLAAKQSGVLILPTLIVLALADLVLIWRSCETDTGPASLQRRAASHAGALIVIFLVGYLGLWAFYGFRYAARPGSLVMTPSLAAYSAGLSTLSQKSVIAFFAQHHLLPEAYLFGWVDILLISSFRPAFIFGHLYSSWRWFYLPGAFLIKSTLFLLVLLALLPLARFRWHRREPLFLGLPVIVFLLFAIPSGINMGIRHILPIYPFCIVLAAAGAVSLASRSKVACTAVAAGLLLTAISSLHSFPDYLAYSNEIAGGPAHTYRLISDANADWGQTLKWSKTYLDRNSVSDCWLAYNNPLVPTSYYGIPCKPLPSAMGHIFGIPSGPVPAQITGTILVSSTETTGLFWGSGDRNPYAAFRDRTPDALIGNAMLVYRGTFHVPLLAAYSDSMLSSALLAQGKSGQALSLAQAAYTEMPNSAEVNAVFSQALLAAGRLAESQQHRQAAFAFAQKEGGLTPMLLQRILATPIPAHAP